MVMSQRILHLGLGSFHRAHQAVYLQNLYALGDSSWTIAAGNIRGDASEAAAALTAQGGRYTLETVTPQGERRYEDITSIGEVVPFEPSLARLVALGADAATRIISFTVTEAGYFLDQHNRLDPSHPDIAADLKGGAACTIYGALAAILAERMRRGGRPVTLLSCDNLRSNGERFRGGMLDFLERCGQGALRDWVKRETTSPSCMVDRITPRPTPDVAHRVEIAVGWHDAAPVMAESFIQWVIEDHFAAGRPAWERVGAELVASVHAHEEAKIRILNATHSCLAWAGTLKGLRYIHEDLQDPAIRCFGFDYVTDDVIPCLNGPGHPSPIDLAGYRDLVLERFGNPYIQDLNQRVAMDGFSKIPGFIAPTVRECIALGKPMDAVAVLPALFFEFLRMWNDGRLPYRYEDGVMNPADVQAFFAAPDALGAFCGHTGLWGDLAGHSALGTALRSAHLRVLAFMAG